MKSPFKYSNTNKRYKTFTYFLNEKFGGKLAKISLDAGFSCPNKDGTCGTGGCIYCSKGSAAPCNDSLLSLKDQYLQGVQVLDKKWVSIGYIPYLQANTNTYAPIEKLKEIYNEVLNLPDAKMIDIATRPDCLSSDVINLLVEISNIKPLIVELGLQTSNDKTAEIINRGYNFDKFIDGYTRLRNAGGNIYICVHIIEGLPGETKVDMINTAKAVSNVNPDMVKIHSLHVIKDTKLEEMYQEGKYTPITLEEYVDVVCDTIELLDEKCTIARITGDGKISDLVAPRWSANKKVVMNSIDKEFVRRDSYQGSKRLN